MTPLTAPFPYIGGKRDVATLVWERIGNVGSYVEPFFGSGAVLLARPGWRPDSSNVETANDADGLLCNFWRAVRADPEGVAAFADWPVSECDLHARHAWLVGRKAGLAERLMGDPEFYDAKAAGWWVWGACCWIGSGWCSGKGPWVVEDGALVKRGGAGVDGQLPHLGDNGRGANKQCPHLPHAGMRINKQLPHVGPMSGDAAHGIKKQMPHSGNAGTGVTSPGIHAQVPYLRSAGCGDPAPGTHAKRPRAWDTGVTRKMPEVGSGRGVASPGRREGILAWMSALSERLARVRICCGDWSRICGPTPTLHAAPGGVCGVFLDPPYAHSERASGLYAEDHDVSAAVREWAIEAGRNPAMRICLAGYDGEHAMPASWEEVAWKARGGYGSQGVGRGRDNARRERLWFSPGCLKMGLFAALEPDECGVGP